MPAIVIAVLVGVAFFFGYRYYSKYLAEKVYVLDKSKPTPAHGIAETWSHLRRGVSYTAIIVDGKTLFSGRIPKVGDAVEAVKRELDLSESEMAVV